MTSVFRPKQGELEWSWVEISGPDARDYLQRLTTVDARKLSPGQGAPGFFLNAQGKVQGVFHLWQLSADRFAFEFEGTGGLKQALLNWIEQFHFAETFSVSEPAGLQSAWIFPLAAEAGFHQREEQGVRVCAHGTHDFGKPWLTAWGDAEALEKWLAARHAGAKELPLPELERWRIEGLRPRAGFELDTNAIPLEAGMLEAIAQDKGCYPGQEVIERILSMGQPARRLVRIEGQGPAPQRGARLTNLADPPAEIGTLTSATETSEGFVALGWVRKIHAREGLSLRVEERDATIRAVSALSET